MGGVINVTAPPAAAGSGGSSSGGASGSALTSTDVNITAEQFADATQSGNGWLTYIPPSPEFVEYSSQAQQAYEIGKDSVDFGNSYVNGRLGQRYSAFETMGSGSEARNAVYRGDYSYLYRNDYRSNHIINRINLRTGEIKSYNFEYDDQQTNDMNEIGKYMCHYYYYLSIDSATGNLYVCFSPQVYGSTNNMYSRKGGHVCRFNANSDGDIVSMDFNLIPLSYTGFINKVEVGDDGYLYYMKKTRKYLNCNFHI